MAKKQYVMYVPSEHKMKIMNSEVFTIKPANQTTVAKHTDELIAYFVTLEDKNTVYMVHEKYTPSLITPLMQKVGSFNLEFMSKMSEIGMF